MHRRLEFLRVGIIHFVSLVATTIIAVWLAYKGFGYYAIMTKAILQSSMVFAISFVMCKTRFGLAFDINTFKSIFRFSGWLMASVVFRNLAHQVDKLLMPRLLSVSALGAYNRPKDFINQISTKLNGIFDTAMFPVLSSIQDEPQKLQNAFRQSLYTLNLFAILLTLSFVVNSELIVRIFLGSEWLELTNVMIVLSLVLVFNIDGRLSDCYLRSMGMTKQQFYFRVFEAIIKIIGVLIGYSWGIIGVALSVIVTNAITKIIKIVYIASKVNITPQETLTTIIVSWRFSLCVVPLCWIAYFFLPHNLLGNVILAIFFSVLTLVLFVFFPNIIGKMYAETTYPKLIPLIKAKLHIK
jgi:O-antigen/teichoic acid export membrane protein